MQIEPTKPKIKLFKRIGNIVRPIIRGVLKSIPILNPVIEIIENFKNEAITKNEGLEIKKHNYLSILFQLICVGAVVYAFATKQITVDDVLKLLNFNNNAQAPTN